MTITTRAQSDRQQDVSLSAGTHLIDTHWASLFEQRLGRGQQRAQEMRDWLAANETRAREVAARLGEPSISIGAGRGRGVELIDVIELNEPFIGEATSENLVFRGWGSRNLYRPDTGGLRFGRMPSKTLDHRFVEAYDDGAELLFVSHPNVIRPEHAPLLAHLDAKGWTMALSPYGTHVRNASMRLSFTEHSRRSVQVEHATAARFEQEADERPACAMAVTEWGYLNVLTVTAPRLFRGVLEGLTESEDWVLATSDKNPEAHRPGLQILFRDARAADRFAQQFLASEVSR